MKNNFKIIILIVVFIFLVVFTFLFFNRDKKTIQEMPYVSEIFEFITISSERVGQINFNIFQKKDKNNENLLPSDFSDWEDSPLE